MAKYEPHAHYCPACLGYSSCLGERTFSGDCLDTLPCTKCDGPLEWDTPFPVVERDGEWQVRGQTLLWPFHKHGTPESPLEGGHEAWPLTRRCMYLLHAHLCPDCEQLSPCVGPAPFRGVCRAAEKCMECDRDLNDSPPIGLVIPWCETGGATTGFEVAWRNVGGARLSGG